MSIGAGALSEDEFQHRINRVSSAKIECMFILKYNEHIKSDNNIETIYLKTINGLSNKVSYPMILFRNLPHLIKQDIFVMHDISSEVSLAICLFCKLFRKKSMITVHGIYDEEWKLLGYSKFYINYKNYITKIILKLVDMIVVNDKQLEKKLIYQKKRNCHLLIREVFVDIEKFYRKNINMNELLEIRLKYKIPDRYVLFVGSLDEWDGIMDLLSVFKMIHDELPECKCVIVGEERVDAELMRYKIDHFIKVYNLNNVIIRTGKVNHDIIRYLYYSAYIIILPMHPPQAGVGRIILEALSMEVPVITYNIGMLNQVVIDNVTGYCVQYSNLDLMASKAIFLLKNSALRKKFGSNGRELVRNRYDLNEYITNWANSINILIDNKGGG